MDTMTPNTLADLRSMEHATDDKKDRYLLGLCTLFVATIEDAKDRISQLELVFCSQLFPAFQTKLLDSRQAFQESESVHKQALQEWQTSKEELLCEIQELRADRESQVLHLRQELQRLLDEIQARTDEALQCKLELQEQSKLHKLEVDELQQELSILRRESNLLELQQGGSNHPLEDQLTSIREGHPANEPGAPPQSAELHQENSKFLQEHCHIHEKASQISAELRSLKSKRFSKTLTAPETSSDIKNLQHKLERKSRERSLECFRRQLLSAEVEKERKATHAALVKLHSLKKRYQSLRKQYTVLFRHSHLLDLQKQSVEPGFDEEADERYSNTNADGLKNKYNCRKPSTHAANPSTSRATKLAASQLPEDTPSKCLDAEAVSADDFAWQASKGARMQKMDNVASFDSPESPNTAQKFSADCDDAEKVCRVLDTPQKLHHLESHIINKGSSWHPDCDQVSDCDKRLYEDKASQVGPCSRSSLKVASHANHDEIDENNVENSSSLKVANPEDGDKIDKRAKDNVQDSTKSLEALQRKIVGGGNVQLNENGWLPVQKRASTTKYHPNAYKSLKTTWRNTRSRAEINGLDPHDDFLDTPQENVFKCHTENAKIVKHEADAVHGDQPVTNIPENEGILISRQEQEQLEGKNISFSQVTTQAPDPEAEFVFHVNQSETSKEQTGGKHLMNKNNTINIAKEDEDVVQNLGNDKNKKLLSSVMSKAKGLPVAKQGPMYKFVETIRRKDEREKLQGIECDQCKKFYDAVHLNDAPGAVSGRCDHRDVVSRHRYRYVPPSTPEGFWNIGFDSEM